MPIAHGCIGDQQLVLGQHPVGHGLGTFRLQLLLQAIRHTVTKRLRRLGRQRIGDQAIAEFVELLAQLIGRFFCRSVTLRVTGVM